MKLFAFITLAISLLASSVLAKGPISTPYTLTGVNGACTLTVYEIGEDPTWPTHPKIPTKPANPHWKYYADVSVDSVSDVVFHVKSGDGIHYSYFDGTSRLSIRLTGASIHSETPFLGGDFHVYKERKALSSCFGLKK